MKKIILFLIIFCFYKTLSSQNKIEFDKLPFEIEVLKNLSYKKDSIMPRFIVDKFYYVNINTNEKLSDIGFQAAYPFVGRKFTIIKIDDNFGIIDNNGRIVVKPTYKLFQLWNTPMRENFIALCRENNCSSFVVFDLDKGDYTIPNNGCAIPDYERERLIIFKSENQKYGVNQLDENYQNPKPVIKPVFDSIYDIRNSFIIAKKNENRCYQRKW
ncbi:WG repeat-containing protein [Chryseobacterium caseinilyticum]|uniref:WG repeat-containing protein n=1 Tax=Chryseobacterium caseinilyticum TaxID=2771428 RepID=A0ABR8ZH51_9FLAO|nr:WG repeat-containing protein [Chryseobacterium caseinilyticum]MBD8084592.1 WG repeat-containing protein [Chryseobacterium caseinilyticum]